MKKEWNIQKSYFAGYAITILVVMIMFSILYQRSYERKLETKEAKNIVGTGQKVAEAVKEIKEKQVVNTESHLSDKVKPSTEYILETYNITNQEGFTETLSIPVDFIGMNRNEILSYLNEYMMEMPLEEYEKGLVSYELISFSEKSIVLKKTYHSDAVLYKYYIVVEDNVVVVYYCDKKTVYEYTGINASDLDMEERIRLSKGIEVETEEELYSILENYSS